MLYKPGPGTTYIAISNAVLVNQSFTKIKLRNVVWYALQKYSKMLALSGCSSRIILTSWEEIYNISDVKN